MELRSNNAVRSLIAIGLSRYLPLIVQQKDETLFDQNASFCDQIKIVLKIIGR